MYTSGTSGGFLRFFSEPGRNCSDEATTNRRLTEQSGGGNQPTARMRVATLTGVRLYLLLGAITDADD